MEIVAALARHNAIVARALAHQETRELSPWMVRGTSAAEAEENATAPAIDNQNSAKSSGLVIVNGAVVSWTLGAAIQMTICKAHSGAAR